MLVSSCSFFKKKQEYDPDAIARVNDEYLYASDLTAVTKGLHGKDSLAALKAYAENWMQKKLLLQKAKENIEEDDAGINRKVEEYRETLLLYEYEKAYIYSKLDTAVKLDELSRLYETLKTEFPLTGDVYQVLFIKLRPDAPDLTETRKFITQPKTDEDTVKLNSYCREFATSFSVEQGMWFAEEKLLMNFPLSKFELQQASASKKWMEYKRTDQLLFFRVLSTMKQGEPSPLELVRAELIKLAVEKRKMELLQKAYDKIYTEGKSNKTAELLLP